MVSENQVRNIFVAKAFPGHEDIAELKAGTIGDLAALQSKGVAVANDSDIMFVSKNNKGTLSKSDVINPANVTSASVTQYSAGSAGTTTISAITATADKLYSVDIVFKGYGSLSVENELILSGYYKAKTGDDAENIVDGLIESLSRSLGRQEPSLNSTTTYTKKGGGTVKIKDNIWFALTKTGSTTTAALVITEKTDWLSKYYVAGKKIRLNLDYNVVVGFIDGATKTVVVGASPKGSGYQARNLEYYLLGNRQDSYRTMGYPHNFDVEYDTVLTGKYNVIELEYFDVSRDDPKKSKKQLTILIPYTNLAGNSVTNGLITEINKSLNSNSISIGALPVV